MEVLIGAAIILALLLCMGAGIDMLAFLFLLMLDLLLLSIFIFFVFCLIKLFGGSMKTARFVRIDKNPKLKYKTAFYLIDGEEYANAFPAELIAKKLFYTKRRDKRVCLCKNGDVFDFNSLVTVVSGLVLGASSFVIMLILIMSSVEFH